MRCSRLLLSLVAVSFGALLACGGGDVGDSAEGQQARASDQAAGQMEDIAAREGGTGHAVDVTLAPKNETGIDGEARLDHHGDSVHVSLRLRGLDSGASYPAHIHRGSCQEGGGVAAGLTSVSPADGAGTSETTVAAGQLSMDENYFLQAHLPDGTPAACGDVPAHDGGSTGDSGGGSGGQGA